MILPIILYGSSILRKKSTTIFDPDELGSLPENMVQTLKKAGGIGLAGPQVGMLKDIFIIDTTPLINVNNEIAPIEKGYINPEIVSIEENFSWYSEGCLSIPGIFEEVKRPEKVDVRYLDFNFILHEETLNGIEARIFQHEFDHLLGVLFIDKLSTIRKALIRNKLKQIRNKK